MKATVEPLEGNKVRLSVELDEAEFDKAIDAAFRKIAREVRIPGFRPGKAPRKVLEQRLGSEVGREQALQDALPEFYAQALTEQNVDAIAQPEIDITGGREDGPLAFAAVVEVRPELQVAGYGGLRVTVERPEVPDEQIDAQVDRMREVQATLAEIDRPAIDGDVVTIDIAGSLDGEAQDGLSADDYSYTVGSGAVTPEVDEQLRGGKTGDILVFPATHPDGDEERELEFRILVKQVNERVLPEADDAWAAEASEFDTINELRGSIRQRLELMRRVNANGQLRQRTGEALAGLIEDGDVPDTLVEQETRRRLQDLALRLANQGIDPREWLTAQLEAPDGVSAEVREAAATAVKVDLALRAVAEAEALEADDDEVETEILAVAEQVGQKPRKVREQFERGGQLPEVRSDIRKRKALDWLLEQVEIVDEDGQPLDRAAFEMISADSPLDEAEADDTDDTEIDEMETKDL